MQLSSAYVSNSDWLTVMYVLLASARLQNAGVRPGELGTNALQRGQPVCAGESSVVCKYLAAVRVESGQSVNETAPRNGPVY